MRECCIPENLRTIKKDADRLEQECIVCGRKHIQFNVQLGKLGTAFG